MHATGKVDSDREQPRSCDAEGIYNGVFRSNTFGCYSRMYDLLAQKAEEKDEKSIV